jgi:hypothetical protein
MLRYAPSICCLILATCFSSGQAQAQNCPEYFRFVDFGVSRADGSIHPGGPTFKVKRDGKPLFESGSVACRDIVPVFTDGHNQPIPLVTTFSYAPSLVASNMTSLSLTRTPNTSATDALVVVQRHRTIRNEADAAIINGADFLCASGAPSSAQTISCEVVNPFEATLSFIVSCDGATCAMSAMAIDDAVHISANWSNTAPVSAKTTGEVASEMAAKIHAFIKDKSAL